MQRSTHPISLNTLNAILSKDYAPQSLTSDSAPRYTVMGFITSISASELQLYDGTATVKFDAEQPLPFQQNQTVRLHLLITKSLQVRIIFSENIQFAEQFMLHWVDAVRANLQQQKQSGQQSGEGFANFFDGLGDFQ
ncbi:hypothetical protein SS50377_22572 [Spironucleus salmonicida]|uniref:Uncharacterized protein n=1 Tax=Spironucleus salmonicida TaxID=348837 RepID=V6LE16_9EUKA|nr:hypothetical protein SS50377_22572 [Spironucleus salmonicida]|eukprot:EST41936.1 hypothetical protein SS50377_18240 [Spironucleus salmonicida]